MLLYTRIEYLSSTPIEYRNKQPDLTTDVRVINFRSKVT